MNESTRKKHKKKPFSNNRFGIFFLPQRIKKKANKISLPSTQKKKTKKNKKTQSFFPICPTKECPTKAPQKIKIQYTKIQ